MRKLTVVVVVLALAAGITSANAEKKQSISRNLANTICQGRDSCISCYDQQCDHGHSVDCPKKGNCTLVTWIVAPPKHILNLRIQTIGRTKAAAPQSKIPGGGILDDGRGLGSQSPAATTGSPVGGGAPPAPMLK